MRRTMRVLLLGGALLGAATSCGTATNPPPGSTPGSGGAGTAAAAPGSASAVKASCEALGNVYSANMASFAESLTKLTTGKDRATLTKQAQESLRDFAAAVGSATQASQDTTMRQDGKQTAARLRAKAADAAVFSKIKTTEDVNALLGPTLKEWLSPVQHHCS